MLAQYLEKTRPIFTKLAFGAETNASDLGVKRSKFKVIVAYNMLETTL